MKLANRTESETARFAAGIVAVALVAGYFAAPLLKYAEPGSLYLTGGLFGVGVGSWWALTGYESPTWQKVIAGLLILWGAISLLVMLGWAIETSRANDQRCLAIQRDMLSSMPFRSDGPDLFQALGCRPQGEGSVYAERDTKGDVGAIFAKSVRRGALPYRNPFQATGSRVTTGDR